MELDIEDIKTPAQAYLYNYHRGKLAFGLILFEFNDAIKEGYGNRLLDIYKLALLFYKAGGHTKYAYLVLLYIVRVVAILSQSEAQQLKWNHFLNKHGSRGWPVLPNQLPVMPSPALVLRSALSGFETPSRLTHALSASCGTACGDLQSSVGHQRTVYASPSFFFY